MGSRTSTVRTTQRRLRAVNDQDANEAVSLSDALPRLATALDDAAERAGWGARPSLVRVTAAPAAAPEKGFDLGIRPLDDEGSVVDALAGFTAPSEWMAIGVVTEGNARHLVDAGTERRRVRCVHLVDRSGASASTLRLQGDDPTVFAGDDDSGRGRIDDACRRALGLPTPPAEARAIELWAVVWLDRVLQALAEDDASDPPPDWDEIVCRHPAVAMVLCELYDRGEDPADNLVRLATRLAEVHSWPVLRQACAAGDWPVDGIPPDVAAWLDDGSFSRWVLGACPALGDLRDAACDLLPPSLRRRLRATLRSWGLEG
jgi:hypothetical protein